MKDEEEVGKAPELIGTVDDIEEAWRMYTMLEALDWRHLPAAGGLGDQDEVLMNNIFAISHEVNRLRK